jgi:hypothetical protein
LQGVSCTRLSRKVSLLHKPTGMEYFNSLDLSEKRKFLWEQGRYVLTTDFYGARVKLFSLDSSFVEVYYHPVEKKVMRISVATETDLNKHLSGIRVVF